MPRRDDPAGTTTLGSGETPSDGPPDEPSPHPTDPGAGAPDGVESTGSEPDGAELGGFGPPDVGPPAPAPEVPDPFEDAEALGGLEHRITTLAAHITAATHRFLVLVADFDRRRGWQLGGYKSCAE